MITQWIQQYLLYILGGALALALIWGSAQTVRLSIAQANEGEAKAETKVVQAQLDSSQAVIRQLAVATDELSVRLADSQAEARRFKEKYDRANEAIKTEIIPTDCEGAAKWAREKAPLLLGKW